MRYRAEYDESTMRLREVKLKYKAECDELVPRQNTQHNESLRRQKEENLKYKAE